MSLRDTLASPLTLGYDASLGGAQPAQQALRDGRRELVEWLPAGYRVRVSGAAQNLPRVPWLAVLDLEVTATAQEGLYVVYLVASSLDRVYLSMNQGATAHRDRFRALGSPRPGVAAIAELGREASVLRGALDE